MSLVTVCPACGTAFKVVQDQLRVSEGWVRCGACSEVFDGTSNLQEGSSLDPGPVSFSPETARIEPTVQSPVGGAVESVVAEVPAGPQEHGLQGLPDPLPPKSQEINPPEFAQSLAMRDLLDETAGQPTGPIGFLKPERAARSVWARRGMAVCMSIALVVGMGALAAQVLLQERDRVLALRPDTRPALAALCDWMGCQLGPHRQIEALVVEGTSFNAVRPGYYRLSAGVRNTAGLSVAAPALELTLHDAQDEVLVRRIVTAQEAGFAQASIASGADVTVSFVLSVSGISTSSSKRMAGYRVLAFYP